MNATDGGAAARIVRTALLISIGLGAVGSEAPAQLDKLPKLRGEVKLPSAGLTKWFGGEPLAQIRKDYPGPGPGVGGGGSPHGTPIVDKFSQPSPNSSVQGPGPQFFLYNQAQLRVGYYPPDPAAGGWALWVKRKVP